MLNWIFKKKTAAEQAPVRPSPAPAPVAAPAETAAAREARLAEWAARLGQASGDDAALLALAREDGAPVDIKVAAIEALAGEAALKDAEREFRTHDRRVYRLAKQRLAAAVATRSAREAAAALLASAEGLAQEAVIPANRLVALDRDWKALDASLLAPESIARFGTLTTQLTALMHDRAEREAAVTRWTAGAREAVARLQTVSLAVAQGAETQSVLTAAAEAAAALQAGVPQGHDDPALVEALGGGRLTAAQIETRLALLAQFEAPVAEPAPPADVAAEPPGEGAPEPVKADPVALATDRWRTQPPIGDDRVAQALEQRFAVWRRSQGGAPAAPAPEKKKDKPPRPKPAAPDPEAIARADTLLAQAETALAEGHLAEAHQQLTALDDLVSPAQRGRLQGLWAEHGRLKGWQQWGGARARDDLVAEAEALATATEVPDAKIAPRQQADTIDALRKRWKELDRTGGPSSQPLWQRFDAALKTAYGPVAAALAKVDAERQANLAAREALLAVLEATPAAEETGWREQVRALDTFQTAWRKLGPVEHTVPHKSREALVARWRAALARIEVPLEAARKEAERGRESLIARAQALAAEGASGQGRDLVPRVRDLQAEWQEHAKSVPLSRGAENSLWTRFKAGTDAVFAQREAVFNARDEVLRANLMAREALVERLAALTADTPAAELKRTLSEVDAQWRQAGDVPRQDVPRIDVAWRNAREIAQSHLAASAQRKWQVTVESVLARHALCEQRERDGASPALDEAWSAQPAVPTLWERALADRWASSAAPVDADTVDQWLLQVEMALDMPSPEAFQAARREWKLRAMKAALESRQSAAEGTVGADDGFARLLGQSGLAPVQRERFDAIVAVLRTRPR
ncbi:DUF349 domain-containing protein [Piscinibacter gummiphilus]|uniref:Uncharacterized protein n=1 Tax=Piscinibacter gummiphilus TaxID=946333 RepID=A0A1W6LGZ3_9BURK|nr:DUF349 domain-containing protein [Piscinibacter gummiphilus]ARN23467.1 hypothetical protein A4W93_28190 [Piscinibacter gummiphilus]ATU68173.1 DUF349 domain-containing protein [Piscinibacter gummiphilus]GLS97490.1 hypothetical protein GCM10007918_47820 [Piscinibacter gummiphilus]